MKEFKIEEFNINTIRKVSEENARILNALPVTEDEDNVYLYVVASEEKIIEEMKFKFGKNITIINISKEKLKFYMDMVYLGQKDNCEYVIIKSAIEDKASDIHFEPFKDKVLVRFRIDGSLKVKYIMTNSEYLSISSKIKISSNLDITERRKPQDGKLSIKVDKNTYDIRVAITPVIFGEKVVLRIFYGNLSKYSLDNLQLVTKQREILEKIIMRKTGLVIVNGPTGSGKSTTLYSILQHENKTDINIITLEDPVEVILPGVNQVMVNTKESIGFAEGIKSALRQDPDIIMLGEIRDEDTAEMAIRAALTGHKVYTTIHCKEPREVYFRLEEMGVKKYLINDAVTGIISQRLIKLLCNNCKVKEGEFYTKGEGCQKCGYTGYHDRALVAAIYYLDKKSKADLANIYEDEHILSNSLMISNLDALLNEGRISKKDYQEFINREEIECDKYEENFK